MNLGPILFFIAVIAFYLLIVRHSKKEPFVPFNTALDKVAAVYSSRRLGNDLIADWLNRYWDDVFEYNPKMPVSSVEINWQRYSTMVTFGLDGLCILLAASKGTRAANKPEAAQLRSMLFQSGYTVHRFESGLLAEATSDRCRRTQLHPEGAKECAESVALLIALAGACGLSGRLAA